MRKRAKRRRVVAKLIRLGVLDFQKLFSDCHFVAVAVFPDGDIVGRLSRCRRCGIDGYIWVIVGEDGELLRWSRNVAVFPGAAKGQLLRAMKRYRNID